MESQTRLYREDLAAALDLLSLRTELNGALAARLAAGASLEESIAFASRAAAISTTRLGAQDSLPRLEELEG